MACGANCGVVGIGALVVVVVASGRSHLARTHPIEDGCDMGSDVDRRMEQDPVVVLGLFRNKKAQTGSTIHLARVSDLDRWCVRALDDLGQSRLARSRYVCSSREGKRD